MEKIDLAFFGYIGVATLCVAITIVLVTNRHAWMPFFSGEWARTIDRARQQKAAREQLYGYATVNHSQVDETKTDRIMSRQTPQTRQTDATDADGRRVSVQNRLWDEFVVDKTRARLIAVMVDSGMTVPEIRALIKGENGAIGAEVEAARQRLGIVPPAPYVTPYVGRPTSARFETDADFPYQAPAH